MVTSIIFGSIPIGFWVLGDYSMINKTVLKIGAEKIFFVLLPFFFICLGHINKKNSLYQSTFIL